MQINFNRDVNSTHDSTFVMNSTHDSTFVTIHSHSAYSYQNTDFASSDFTLLTLQTTALKLNEQFLIQNGHSIGTLQKFTMIEPGIRYVWYFSTDCLTFLMNSV